MHDLAEVRRLRAHIPAPDTDQAFALLAEAMAGEQAAAGPAPSRGRRARLAAAAAAVAAAVAAGAVMLLPSRAASPTSPPGRPAAGARPSHAEPRSAAELVAYATSAAARSAVSMPSPHDWMYLDVLSKGMNTAPYGYRSQGWEQVDFHRSATLHNGELIYHGCGGICAGAAHLTGWPGTFANLYQYLATLPTRPAALRKIILADNHNRPRAAFDAVSYLLNDLALPPRFQAELYAVVASLPGTRFDQSATDAAGRHGVGLYRIEEGFLKQEIIVSPRTYAYMGLLSIAVKARTQHGYPAVLRLHKGSIEDWTAVLNSGIVGRAGQVP